MNKQVTLKRFLQSQGVPGKESLGYLRRLEEGEDMRALMHEVQLATGKGNKGIQTKVQSIAPNTK
jgi:hypothetical protein